MPRKKLFRFQENTQQPNLLEPSKELYTTIKGQWHEAYFNNAHPITLELACGRGEYTTGLAPQFPYKNFIGVDVKGDRLWKGSTVALSQNLTNVAFLRTQIQQLEDFFAPGEVSEIWITFPDPRPKDRDERRRLTHPRFLEIYQRILAPESIIHLKTDNLPLFEYTLEILKDWPVKDLLYTKDLYHDQELFKYHYGIKTRYEMKFVAEGFKINYLQFKFN